MNKYSDEWLIFLVVFSATGSVGTWRIYGPD